MIGRLAVAAVLLGAPAAMAGGGDVTPADLAGTVWEVTVLGGEAVRGTPPTLEFGGDGQVSGDTGCNRFTVGGSGGLLGPIAATKRFCASAAQQEQRYLEALEAAAALERPAPDRLLVSGPVPLELRRR